MSILRTWGLPYFHMAEFASARGKLFGRFSGDEDAQNRLIHPLAKLVRDHVTVAFAGSVEVRHIEAAVPAELREWFAPLPTAFQVCMQVLIKRWAEKRVPAREQLGVIFDQDNCPRMLQLHAAYNQLTAVWDETGRLGPVQFADKKRVIPLQTADMLAHQVFRHLKDGLPETGEIRNVLRWMLEGVREQYVTTIDEAGLATVVAKMLRQRPDRPPTT